VIVIDDTYTSGAHAQSVAKLVKNAGAAKVSILTVARWIEMEKPPVKQFFLDRIANEPYDPMICPWTGSGCPRPP
jgi:hypoxanthine-guanine phosphoribosyltransferase